MNVLDKITWLRLERNWSEYQLAEKSGLTQSTISTWYRKNMLPSLSSLEKICTAFDMSMAQFFSEGSYRELDYKQSELLNCWELLTPKQKELFFELIHSVAYSE